MSEWKEYKFSDFVLINPTVKLPANERVSFVEMKDLVDGKRYCYPSATRPNGGGAKFENRDTLFARITPCLENGKICQVKDLKNGVGLGSTEFLVFRGKPNISDTDFVFYLSRWNEVRSHAEVNLDGTSGRQRVPKDCFNELILTLPESITEQSAIASILSSLDDKIDLLHRQNATLEKMAETLFRQWFVEDVEESREVGTLSDFGEVITGKTPSKENPSYWGDKYHFVTPSDFKDFGMFTNQSTRRLSELGWSKLKSLQLPQNSILVTCIGSDMGKVTISSQPCITNQQLNSIIIRDKIYLGYVFEHIKSQYQNIRNIAFGGTTMPIINKTDFQNIDTPVPPKKVVELFNNQWEVLANKVFKNQTQIRTLTALRDTLLPKLMSGEAKLKM